MYALKYILNLSVFILFFGGNMFEIHEIIENDEYLRPLTAEDWIKPGRPATEEEFIQMLEEADKGPYLNLDDALKLSIVEFEAWKKSLQM